MRVIQRFRGMPFPIICPSFYKLQAFFGCEWGKCRECYLRGTYFRKFGGKVPRPTIYKGLTWQDVHNEIKRFTYRVNEPQMLSVGELADSLSFENKNYPVQKDSSFPKFSFSELIIPLMEALHKHKVLFLTKLTNVSYIREFENIHYTVLSWTLNLFEVARLLGEPPNVSRRILSGQLCKNLGYEVRVRIDPIMPDFDYELFIMRFLDRFTPSRITLGSLRVNNPVLPRTEPEFWKEWLPKMVNLPHGKKRFPIETDVQSFSKIIDALKDYGYNGDIAICKELKEVWEGLGLDWRHCKCNCVL